MVVALLCLVFNKLKFVWAKMASNSTTVTLPIAVNAYQVVSGSRIDNASGTNATVGYVASMFGIATVNSTTITRTYEKNGVVPRNFLVIGI